MIFLGQSHQDEFVLRLLNFKRDGYFLEIGSNDPIQYNNSYILEKEYNWKGIMIEYDKEFEPKYKENRNSYYIIKDATEVNYEELFIQYNFPNELDYLQIDLEVTNESTLKTLELLDRTIMNKYTFKVVTFEHDIYRGNYYDTRNKSREIFNKNGYIRVFSDVMDQNCPYEDWYVHSSFQNVNLINILKTETPSEWTEIFKKINKVI
jgi:hypothetical protein